MINTECPACGHHINATYGLNDGEDPGSGDVSVCFYCGCICEFTADHVLRILSEEEVHKPEYSDAIVAREKVRAYRGLVKENGK